MSPSSSPRARARRGTTRWTVRWGDRIASRVIAICGVATIAAVSLVFALLAWIAGPLFRPARVDLTATVHTDWQQEAPMCVGTDEYRAIGWGIFADGSLRYFHPGSGAAIGRETVADQPVTAVAQSAGDSRVLLGLGDGSVRMVTIEFAAEFIPVGDAPPEAAQLTEGEGLPWRQGVLQRTGKQPLRWQRLKLSLQDPLVVQAGVPIVAVDVAATDKGYTIVAACQDGSTHWGRWALKRNLVTGGQKIQGKFMPVPAAAGRTKPPQHVFVTGREDGVCLIWSDGHLARYTLQKSTPPQVAEELNVLEQRPDVQVTAATLLLGRETLIIGDSQGGLTAWFTVRSRRAETQDGRWLLPVHPLDGMTHDDLPGTGSRPRVTCLGTSQRGRIVTAGFSDGAVRIYQVTTESRLAECPATDELAWRRVLLSPKEDGVWAFGPQGEVHQWNLDVGHPEATLSSLFGSVWYEGDERPAMVWQSSSGGVDSEMKLGLGPLIFGTFKATFYSLLFGAPLAFLAAIYSSEFVKQRQRMRIKSVVEMMASLPSVVLGFLAALVVAPVLKDYVSEVFTGLVTLPITTLIAAYLWQLLPRQTALHWGWLRLPLLAVTILLAGWLAVGLGPTVERMVFGGNVIQWLDRQHGSGWGAWFVLWLPLCTMLVTAADMLWVHPLLRLWGRNWSRQRMAIVHLFTFLLGIVCVFLLTGLVSNSLTAWQWDPRGTYLGTYVHLNALVVGLAMGFAIIPIIYTVADDALSAVPSHLRSASLGAGATPWQTAVRVVIPTAMSGLFSALMIGLGRAVGETMIVLMAAGNTPVWDWNIFNGFRTLSANIAVEMPEAARDTTHYRTLFLAALMLLAITFVLNTIAETVRTRFRKRAVQL